MEPFFDVHLSIGMFELIRSSNNTLKKLSIEKFSFDEQEILTLVDCRLSCLTEFKLVNCKTLIGSPNVIAEIIKENAQTLTRVDLSRNNFSVQTEIILSALTWCWQLTHLNLSNIELSQIQGATLQQGLGFIL